MIDVEVNPVRVEVHRDGEADAVSLHDTPRGHTVANRTTYDGHHTGATSAVLRC